MAKQSNGKNQTVQSEPRLVSTVVAPLAQLRAATQIPTAAVTASPVTEDANLKTCLTVLAGVQDQVKFGDTKAAFVFAINTLMCGFIAGSLTTLKMALKATSPSAWAWVLLAVMIVFGGSAVFAVGTLILAVMSRLGALAPRTRVFFGHIACSYGKDYGKYVDEIRAMDSDEWLKEIGTQIVETSHIALNKHRAVRQAAIATIVGLVAWLVAIVSAACLS
jgi:hypothetical protein